MFAFIFYKRPNVIVKSKIQSTLSTPEPTVVLSTDSEVDFTESYANSLVSSTNGTFFNGEQFGSDEEVLIVTSVLFCGKWNKYCIVLLQSVSTY